MAIATPIPAPEGWQAQRHAGSSEPGPDYTCPRCQNPVRRNRENVVAWTTDGESGHRHWHPRCWQSAVKEGIERSSLVGASMFECSALLLCRSLSPRPHLHAPSNWKGNRKVAPPQTSRETGVRANEESLRLRVGFQSRRSPVLYPTRVPRDRSYPEFPNTGLL
jgi:hypothetical protein